MTNVEKYLGYSKLTAECEGYYFDESTMKSFKSRIGKILKNSEDEIIFITSEKYYVTRLYSVRVLKRLEGKTSVTHWTDKKFSSSAKAIAYYKKESK
jgi:hypothetical protein